ncbi:hypothetical protein BDV06DRAFT_182389 [Aspergillus oleicola]
MRARAPIDTLSYELFDQILLYLSSPVEYGPPAKPNYLCLESTFPSTPNKCRGLAQYAAVSKKWKQAVERFTFNTIQVSSGNLPRLSNNMSHFNRRYSLRNLFCTIQLLSYSQNRRSNFERRREHQANLDAFRQALTLLFKAVESYHNYNGASRELRLAITADAPVNPPDKDESERRVRSNLGDLRWSYPEHTLTLSDDRKEPPDLGRLINVSHLSIAKTGRRIHPFAIRQMVYALPTLRKLDIRIPPVQAKNKDLRASMRNDLARVLEMCALEQLEYLSIEMEDSTPRNHTFAIASAIDNDYPAGDHLGRAVCKLMQTSLRELYMGPEVLISPVLFGVDPRHPERATKSFPYLTKMQVMYSLVTYDGRWYYDGDADPDGLDWDMPPGDSDNDSDSNSSFNSEYSDWVNEEREEYLHGNRPYYTYRTLPGGLFNDLIGALVSAVPRMSSLCALEVRTNNPGENEYETGVEYVAPGYQAQSTKGNPKYETEGILAKKRWVLSFGYNAGWDIPPGIWEMMLDQVGYHEGQGQIIQVP